MDRKKVFKAIKNGIVDFFSDDEELEIQEEEEIEISLKGLFIFIVAIIVLGLGIYGVRSVLTRSGSSQSPQPVRQAAVKSSVEGQDSTLSFAPLDIEKIKRLAPIEFLDVGAEMDGDYLDETGYRPREAYPTLENDSTFRWTSQTSRMFFPFPQGKTYTSVDLLLTLPPSADAAIILAINGKEYPKRQVDRANPHNVFELDHDQVASGYLDIILRIVDSTTESGVQLLNVRLLEN